MNMDDAVSILKDMKGKGELDANIVDLAIKEFNMILDYIMVREDSIREFYIKRFEDVKKNRE